MVFQLLALLLVAYIIGQFLDDYFGLTTSILTAVCLLAALFAYLYSVIRDTKWK